MAKTPWQKQAIWAARTAAALQLPESETIALLGTERQQSIRLNVLRATIEDTLQELQSIGWAGEPFPWLEEGYSVNAGLEAVRDSQALAAGKVFIQNAASWLPILALEPQRNEEILDVCAAPGGKTSHIAAITDNQARITANDNSRPRLAKMQATFKRLGVKNIETTLFDATQLARRLEGCQFDKILLDAPCSGEGMMQFGRDKDFATWSVAHIKRLQHLQKRIISQAWQLLKPGGRLVYSTCTMAPEENEAVIDYLLRTKDDAHVIPFEVPVPNRVPAVETWNGKSFNPEITQCMRLKPSRHIEAFFICKLQKVAHSE